MSWAFNVFCAVCHKRTYSITQPLGKKLRERRCPHCDALGTLFKTFVAGKPSRAAQRILCEKPEGGISSEGRSLMRRPRGKGSCAEPASSTPAHLRPAESAGGSPGAARPGERLSGSVQQVSPAAPQGDLATGGQPAAATGPATGI